MRSTPLRKEDDMSYVNCLQTENQSNKLICKDNESLFLIVRKGTTNMERKKTRMNSHDIRFDWRVLV